jgi:hypothetical protein
MGGFRQASRIMYTTGYLERAPKALLLASLPAQMWGRAAGQPSTKNGGWPYYAADARGSKYSPLDRINASPDSGGGTIPIRCAAAGRGGRQECQPMNLRRFKRLYSASDSF